MVLHLELIVMILKVKKMVKMCHMPQINIQKENKIKTPKVDIFGCGGQTQDLFSYLTSSSEHFSSFPATTEKGHQKDQGQGSWKRMELTKLLRGKNFRNCFSQSWSLCIHFFFFVRLTPWAHAKQMLYPWELPLSYPTPNSAFILWTHSFRELPSLGPWQSYNSEMPPFSVVQSRTLVRAGDNFYLSN